MSNGLTTYERLLLFRGCVIFKHLGFLKNTKL